MPSPFTHSRSGMSLMNVIVLLMLIGVLVMAGSALVGPLVKRGKINDTKTIINNNVDAIISWSVVNGRLPSSSEYIAILPNPNDAWGKPLVYLYDNGLTAKETGGLCGRNTTTDYNGQQIAFIIVSGGDDYTINSTPSTSAAFSGAPTIDTADLSKVVTLDELKSRSGCYGATGGRLRIINNELPRVCEGSTSYIANLIAEGGVSGGAGYQWTVQNAPNWLACNGIPACPGTFSGSKLTLTAATDAVPPAPNLTFTLEDTGSNDKVSRILPVLKSNSTACTAPPPTVPSVTPADFNGGGPGDGGVDVQGDKITWINNNGDLTVNSKNGTGSNCIWYQEPLILTGQNLAAYFDFTFQDGEGFVFALVPKTQDPPISYCSMDLLGFGTGIPKGPLGTLLGVEFNAAPQSICVATDGTICSGPPNLWTTDGSRYHVRIDLNRAAMQVEVHMCKHGAANCSDTEIDKLKVITAAYAGGLSTIIPPTPPALTTNNLTDLSNFYFGITAGQHDNNNLIMTISDLMVDLY